MITQSITTNHQEPTPRTVKILLVDDQKCIQQQYKEILSDNAYLKVVGTANDGQEAIAQAESLQPDVIMIDIEMPNMNGIEATKIISQRFPDCKILVVSSHDQQEYVQQAIAAGADGYILKNAAVEDLTMAIHSVCRGYSHLAPKLLQKILLAPVAKDVSLTETPKSSKLNKSPETIRRRWIFSVITSLVLFSAIAIGFRALSQKQANNQPSLKELTVPVETESLTVRVEASGTVEPIETVNVSSEVVGKLAELYVERGDTVKAGDVLARLDYSEQQAKVAQAEARLAEAEADYNKMLEGNRREEISRAEAQLNSAQAAVELNAKKLERNRFLAETGAIAQLDLDEIIHEERAARASLQEAEQQLQELADGFRAEDIQQSQARVAIARGELQEFQSQLDKASIKAPFDGIVTQKHANIGAIITPTMASAADTASATPSSIVELASGLEVLVNVPEANIAQVKIGQPVEIIADAYSNRTFKGEVRTIEPESVSEEDVTSFRVRVKLHNQESELRSGMNVDAIFVGEPINNALVVPTVAITNRSEQMGVLIPDSQGQAKFQPVKVGITQDGKTQVIEGLQAEQRVFVDFPDGKAPETLSKPF